MSFIKWIGIGIAVIAIAMLAASALGSWRWDRETESMRLQLEAARRPPSTLRYDVREIAALPAPVQRYFRVVLKDGQPIVTAVTVEHAGSMDMGEAAPKWKPFTSTQRVVMQRPGFDWDARIMMFPGVPVHVHDAYIGGAGVLRGAVLGLIPVVETKSTPELAQGELLRFLAEAAWYPTALLPSQGVRWEPIDDNSARATLVDGPMAVTLTFVFRPEGPINTIRAESRGPASGRVSAGTPWVGRFWNYQTRAGMLVPIDGEVAWLLREGRWPYWRGTNTAMAYEFAQ